jgi:hypothetical protein
MDITNDMGVRNDMDIATMRAAMNTAMNPSMAIGRPAGITAASANSALAAAAWAAAA